MDISFWEAVGKNIRKIELIVQGDQHWMFSFREGALWSPKFITDTSFRGSSLRKDKYWKCKEYNTVHVFMEWLVSQWLSNIFSSHVNVMEQNYATKPFSKSIQLRYKYLASVRYPNIAGIHIYIPAPKFNTSIFAICYHLLSFILFWLNINNQ